MRGVEMTWLGPVVYLVGVAVGLVRVDARPAGRLGWALLWPIGPAAFIATLAVLLVTGAVALVVRD